MRKLTEQFKIPGRSIPEIVSRFNGLISRQQTLVGRKYGKRKVPAEIVTNAVMLYFLDLSATKQDEILNKYVNDIEIMLDSDVEVQWGDRQATNQADDYGSVLPSSPDRPQGRTG